MLAPSKPEEEDEQGLITGPEAPLELQEDFPQNKRQHVCEAAASLACVLTACQYIRLAAIGGGIIVCMGLLVLVAVIVHGYETRAYGACSRSVFI